MNEEILFQIWVFKFCVNIVYPKYHPYTFLIFLAIKSKLSYVSRSDYAKNMHTYNLKALSKPAFEFFIQDQIKNVSLISQKCLIISKKHFVELCAQNLFYIDNGILWVAIKVAPELKLKHNDDNKHKKVKSIRYNLNFITSEIHKKLWTEDSTQSIDNIRIIPIIGNTLLPDDVAYTTETELYNIAKCYGFNDLNIKITFHPVPQFENSPKIASKAEVSLLLNEFDLSNDFLKEVLNNHFDVPKIISPDDMFPIDLSPEKTLKYHYKYLDLVESSGRLYFKCTKIISETETESSRKEGDSGNIVPAFYIVRGVTQLTLGESIHSIKPSEVFFAKEKLKSSCMLHLCPSGLRDKFIQIQETIFPFLNDDMNELSMSMSSPIIPILLLTGALGSGKHLLVKTLAKYNGLNCLQFDCNALQSTTAKQTESKINLLIQKTKAAAPTVVLLDNFEVFAVDPENNEDSRIMEYFSNTLVELYQNYSKHPIIFIAVTDRSELKPNIMRIFLEKIHIPKLTNEQRYQMLEWFSSAMQLKINDDHDGFVNTELNGCSLNFESKEVLRRVAAKTETFRYGDLDTLMHFAVRESYLKQQENATDPDLQFVKEEDFNSGLESIRSLQSQQLDAPKIPKVYWEDIGGLDKLKKELIKTIEFPIKYPHLFKNSSLKRSGILLYGPPGCGKTLVAKAVSTELNVSFMSVKGPELLNMYIGQSEENVRKVFESARASSPCIVFLDELDALAPRRGSAGDSGGASDRVVSQLLAELDGVNTEEEADSSSFVFIMGATNRPDLLEQSLLRPGRLDKLIYVGPYNGVQEKTGVLNALCRNHKLRPEVDLSSVAQALPERCTGADLLSVVSCARAAAVRGLVAKLHAGTVKESELSPDSVVIGVSELCEGVDAFRPSVSDEELAYYESLQM